MNKEASIGQNELPPVIALDESFSLRPLRTGDEIPLLAYLSDLRVTEHTSIPCPDLFSMRNFVDREIAGYASASSRRWALADSTDTLVGTCGFSNWSFNHAHAELVYDLAPQFWGRGLMRRAVGAVLNWAFSTANFNRVHAFVMVTNQPSIRLLEACGFSREGTLRQYRIARGSARDFHVYALLKQDAAA